ncbi:MAG: alanine racemase [Verrucomicrobia bacterium]|nr:alanine racemase [Verrucomicrobiota bacterium]
MSRVYLDIDLDTLRQNFRRIAERVAPCSVMAVLKANAYGLGVRNIAEALAEAGVSRFGVAEVKEGIELQSIGLPTQILGAILPDEVERGVAAGLTLPISSFDIATRISREAQRQAKRVRVHFLIDTGMGRLGIPVKEAPRVVLSCMSMQGLDVEGIYSHFPMAYNGEEPYTMSQIQSFKGLLDGLAADGAKFKIVHIANSDAINNAPQGFAAPFNEVRTGINLYGAFDTRGKRALKLDSVLTLRTSLAAVRILPAGMSIGYGCTHTLDRETRVGTIPAGYADGLPLALSNSGYVLVRGQTCAVLGRVSMDYTTIDLTSVPDAEVGDDVVCLGTQQGHTLHVDDWARIKGTHAYEIICAIGNRVERRYRP